MAIKLGTSSVKEIFLGTRRVDKVYLGTNLVYQAAKWRLVFSGELSMINGDGIFDDNYRFKARIAIPGFSGSLSGKAVQVKAEAVGFREGQNMLPLTHEPNFSSTTASNLPWTVNDVTDVFAGTFTLNKPVGNYIEGEGAYADAHSGYGQWFVVREVWVYE